MIEQIRCYKEVELQDFGNKIYHSLNELALAYVQIMLESGKEIRFDEKNQDPIFKYLNATINHLNQLKIYNKNFEKFNIETIKKSLEEKAKH